MNDTVKRKIKNRDLMYRVIDLTKARELERLCARKCHDYCPGKASYLESHDGYEKIEYNYNEARARVDELENEEEKANKR